MELCGFEVGLHRPLFLIAGPCVVESLQLQVDVAGKLQQICGQLSIPFIFKSSYDKANRSSGESFRGPGMAKGLEVLAEVKRQLNVPVLTDVHSESEIALAAAVVDVLQTPAFLCRQTDFIHAVARAGKPVNIKKGQFLAPDDMQQVVAKAKAAKRCRQHPGMRTRRVVRLPQSDFGHALAGDPAGDRMSGRFRCHAFGAVALVRSARRVAGSASSCRCSPGPRLHPALPVSSWKRIRNRKKRCPTGPTPGRSIECGRFWKR
jgi:hypothetical protein